MESFFIIEVTDLLRMGQSDLFWQIQAKVNRACNNTTFTVQQSLSPPQGDSD